MFHIYLLVICMSLEKCLFSCSLRAGPCPTLFGYKTWGFQGWHWSTGDQDHWLWDWGWAPGWLAAGPGSPEASAHMLMSEASSQGSWVPGLWNPRAVPCLLMSCTGASCWGTWVSLGLALAFWWVGLGPHAAGYSAWGSSGTISDWLVGH